MSKSNEDPGVEIVLDDIIDIEEYAKRGEQPPLAKGYRFKVNGTGYVVHDPIIEGIEVLTIAGFLPAKDHTLWVSLKDGKPRKVELDDKVDLREFGVEKFKALPRDQTDG